MEKAIKKAIEGGYEPFKTIEMSKLICELNGEHFGCNFIDKNVKGFCGANMYRLISDPLFWQALGKAEGWTTQEYHDRDDIYSWYANWHRFIDHLASGEDVGSFFDELLK